MNHLYPLKLTAACKDYIWGGTRLREEYNQHSTEKIIAESWELSCHPDGPSVIANGDFKGTKLVDFLKQNNQNLLGMTAANSPIFPS